jgi:hypothetical protein
MSRSQGRYVLASYERATGDNFSCETKTVSKNRGGWESWVCAATHLSSSESRSVTRPTNNSFKMKGTYCATVSIGFQIVDMVHQVRLFRRRSVKKSWPRWIVLSYDCYGQDRSYQGVANTENSDDQIRKVLVFLSPWPGTASDGKGEGQERKQSHRRSPMRQSWQITPLDQSMVRTSSCHSTTRVLSCYNT